MEGMRISRNIAVIALAQAGMYSALATAPRMLHALRPANPRGHRFRIGKKYASRHEPREGRLIRRAFR